MLAELGRRRGRPPIPKGITHTEFYDLLELDGDAKTSGLSLQREFCDLMKGWMPGKHHHWIVSWSQKAGCPLLTTNFEDTLSKAGGCQKLSTRKEGFSDWYPWEHYYGNEQLDDPTAGFGIWHINGMQCYHRSIRLGLSHYMGSVQRARTWLHRGGNRRLFSGKHDADWLGAQTWLQIIFSKPLVIFGLGLEENEVFLRWLLIERARYFRKFPDKKKAAWYFHTEEKESGKLFFLRGVGVTPVQAKDYDEIYGAATWT